MRFYREVIYKRFKIPYNKDGDHHRFFPDYVICFTAFKCVLTLAFPGTLGMITFLYFSVSWQTVYFGNANILPPSSPKKTIIITSTA